MPTSTVLSVDNKGYVGVFVLILALLLISGAGGYYLYGQKSDPVPTPVFPQTTSTPTPDPHWKVYKNSTYGFQLAYPAKGVIHKEEEYVEGECGGAIKEKKSGSGSIIDFDNLFEMKIIPWSGSIDGYLASQGAKNKYELEVVATVSAKVDEAVSFHGLKKGVEYAVGYPPLVYVSYVFKKDGNIFVIKNDPNHKNPGGCVNPNFIDPVKYAKYKNQGWDFAKSFKFI